MMKHDDDDEHNTYFVGDYVQAVRKEGEIADDEALVERAGALELDDGGEGVERARVELGVRRLYLQTRAHQRERIEQAAHGEHVEQRERHVDALVEHVPLDVAYVRIAIAHRQVGLCGRSDAAAAAAC